MRKYQRMSPEERREYNRKRREQYRLAHPVTTDKQRKIIAARAKSPEEKARIQAERDISEELARAKQARKEQDIWDDCESRKREKYEVIKLYESKMLIAQYKKKIEKLTTEREALMATRPLTSEVINRANQISQLKYNCARNMAELMNELREGKGNKYIFQEYGIKLD